MGGKSSNKCISEYGQLGTQTDHGIYRAGETVEGNVYLLVNKAFPINGIEIRLKGKEEARYRTGHGKHKQIHRGEHVCCDYKAQLVAIKENILMPGQYQFPFTFILPDSLPGTFHYESRRVKGDISYELQASTIVIEKSISPLVYFLPFQVQEQLPSATINQKQSKILQVSGCCSSPGFTTLHYQLDKNYLNTTDNIKIMVELDNKSCTARIKGIGLTIMQRLSLKSSPDAIVKQKEKKVYVTDVEAIVPAAGATNQGIIFEAAIPAKYSQMPTTGGQLVHCNYSAVISLRYGGCCKRGESTEFALLMHYPDIHPVNLQLTPDIQWDPQVFNQNALILNQIINQEPEGASFLLPAQMPIGDLDSIIPNGYNRHHGDRYQPLSTA